MDPEDGADDTRVLTCWNCGGTVVFGEMGWTHAETDRTCGRLIVSWPPVVPDDDTEDG